VCELDAIQVPERRNLLVAFSDLSAFARAVEGQSEEAIFALMADYYELVGDIVTGGGGKVVKFIGDAVLLTFSEQAINTGVLALRTLKKQGDRFFSSRGTSCRHTIKAHFGPVCCGPIGTRDNKHFDLFGHVVNIAARLPGNGIVLTLPIFSRLAPETGQYFKRHEPSATYISIEDNHG